ncbi:MAG: NAD(P)/FAD-dependent oxidoreductase [Bacteroidota bacterium]
MKDTFYTLKSPHLVIIGGGFAGLELVKQLKNKDIRVTLLDKNNYHTFQPLLYQVASGGLGPDGIAYPLRKIVSTCQNVIFRMAKVLEVQTTENIVKTSIGDISYDYLVIATGSTTNFFGNEQLEKASMQLKTVPDALDLRSDILQEFEKAVHTLTTDEKKRILNFVVVGGGPTGVETAGALAEMKKNVLPADYKELDPECMQVHLIESAPRVLATFSEQSSAKALKFLHELGVKVQLNVQVKNYDGHVVQLSTGEELQTETVVWSAGVKGISIPGMDPASLGRGNRYKVNASNLVDGYTNIFAVGDVAAMTTDAKYPNGHPMVAPVGVQQARLFSKNIFRIIKGEKTEEFRYFDKGSMATVGRHKAVLEAFGFRMQGYIAWLAWMLLHLMLLVGFRNRMVVFINWMWNYLSYQRAIRIITRPFVRHEQ